MKNLKVHRDNYNGIKIKEALKITAEMRCGTDEKQLRLFPEVRIGVDIKTFSIMTLIHGTDYIIDYAYPWLVRYQEGHAPRNHPDGLITVMSEVFLRKYLSIKDVSFVDILDIINEGYFEVNKC